MLFALEHSRATVVFVDGRDFSESYTERGQPWKIVNLELL